MRLTKLAAAKTPNKFEFFYDILENFVDSRRLCLTRICALTGPRMPPKNKSTIAGLELNGRCLARLSSRSGLVSDFRRILENGGADEPCGIRSLVTQVNLLARSTSSARSKLYQELKCRYILDPEIPLFSAFLEEWKRVTVDEEKDLLAFVLLALNDRTVMVISCEWFFPYLRRADSELRVGDLETFLQRLGRSGHSEISDWTESTLKHVAKHFLATVRDCGLAQGSAKKRAHRPALYPAPIRFLLRALQLIRCPLPDIIVHESFKIVGIDPKEVIGTLSELNRHDAIRFRHQADVIELNL